ncbi:MAG: proline dehydrogenase family protein, partial [Rhodobacterales bacterium]|nr:proline dehydrogenase family protein [Rhodobacterales bacterium]
MPGPTPPDWTHHKPALWADYQVAEQDIVHRLLAQGAPTGAQRARIQDTAHALVASVRESGEAGGLIAPFLQEYGLSNREGVILMCLAEAMLRVPDPLTVDALIEDKVTTAEWEQHLGGSPSGLVNLSTRSLMFTSRVLDLGEGGGLLRAAHDMVRRMGQPLIRTAVREAMKILGHQFVLGRTIGEALEVAAKRSQYRYSFDMLGEAALTQADADRYFKAYSAAINAVGRAGSVDADVIGNNGVSVKLSALHPRLEFAQRDRVLAELTPRLIDLARLAAGHNIGLTVDAEEADRLDLTMDILGRVCAAPDLKGWHGFGFVVQAYQKRAWRLIDLLTDMARGADRRLMLRMVKGAYWDSEIKRCQEQGLADYPVFTRKVNSDVSYIAATGKALSRPDAFYVQVATHNAHSAAAALVLADGKDFEFQRLHGMGEVLHDRLMADHGRPCRIYAPVGAHEDLLPYLVRRLLENGANSSFVNQIEDDAIPVEKIVRDPFAVVEGHTAAANPRIPLPRDLYGNVRVNARGIDLADAQAVDHLYGAMALPAVAGRAAAPILGGRTTEASGGEAVFDPADHARQVG